MAKDMMDDEEELKGENVEVEEDEASDVRDTDDGGAMVALENEEDHQTQSEHFANIVDDINPKDLAVVVSDLMDKIKRDKDARKKRDEQYEEGIRRTGLGDDAPGGAQFTGANKVVHPLMTEACVDFSARAMKELFPSNGPVRSKIIGKQNKLKLEKAERKAKYMNWQLTEQMLEFRSELEQLTTQLPLGGVQYMKLFWNKDLNRVESVFIPVDDVYLPFAASNFHTAERKTHVQYITKYEYDKRVRSGMYREVDLGMPDDIDYSKSTKANDKIEGREDDSYNEDGLRTVFEITTAADLEGDEFLPYIITVDKATEKCLAVYRNWAESDEVVKEPLVSIVEFPFVPWRGAYPIGLTHMIGGLSGAATGALRALLDSAHISNIPTLLKLKGGPNGQNINPQPTEVIELDGGINVDDVRKIAMPMPFNPPSPVLMQLLGFLVDSGKGVVQTTFEKLSDQNPNMPVGTTLALIEQGMVVFSSIHARLHNSMAQVLKVMHRLNSAYLTEEMVMDEFGEKMVDPSDFDGPLDVIPVSDPNIFSETQRFAQVQAVQQRAMALPQLYDIRKVEELFLKQLKIPEGEELLIPKPEPKDIDPIQENFAASVGKPIGALPEQEHIAHLRVHLAFLQSPMFGQNPTIAPMFVPAIVAHIKDHLLMHYMKMTRQGLEAASNNGQLGEDDAMQEAQAAVEIQQAIEQAIPPEFLQIVNAAFQQAQQFQPPQPQDPTQASAAVQREAIQQRAQSDQMRVQAQQQRDQVQAQTQMQRDQVQAQSQAQRDAIQAELQQRQAQLTMQTEMLKQDREDARKQAELVTRLQMNQEDNETAKDLAAAEILSGNKVDVSTGTGINPNP
jgi:chaperonin GroES